MSERPELCAGLDADTFRSYYYLKEELIRFCRDNGLPVSGGKPELTERIACFLDTGSAPKAGPRKKAAARVGIIDEDTIIEPDIVFSEKHRAFFTEKTGRGFSFNVPFQRWLKDNAGKTYSDAVNAYYCILEEKKTRKTEIGRQFEYNTYIRDFFADNRGKTLHDAIKCWKYKKGLRGHNRYERSDLAALGEEPTPQSTKF